MTRWIGVDPGLGGAIAVFDTAADSLMVHAMPVFELTRNAKAKREINVAALADLIDEAQPDAAVVEQVGAMPGNPGASMFAFGKGYGIILGILAANRITVHPASPAVWKKAMGLQGKGKDASRAEATRLFPEHAKSFARVKDDGMAEAALLCLWASKKFSVRSASDFD